jgi:hypothetical protein
MFRGMYKGMGMGGGMGLGQVKQNFPGFNDPSSEMQVNAADPEDVVVLWRGTTVETATLIGTNRSAGGLDPDPDCGAPSETQARMQVGGYQGVGWEKFPEFTTNWRIAQQFARGAVVCIWIRKKYLIKGSGTEDGWIALREAPLARVRWTRYGAAVGGRLPNAD